MKNVRVIKSNSGFSLVELMVVVAIIGILATVAIPSVNKYMMKARQAEVKTNLSAIYSANKAFSVEYNGFGTHFSIIGYAPEGQLRYDVGFGTPPTLPYYTALGYNRTAALVDSSTTIDVCNASASVAARVVDGASYFCGRMAEATGADPFPVGVVPTATTFTVFGRSRINKAGLVDDTWTMDQAKLLTNTVNGI
ncbi:MAG: type IV pilin protein [Pseudobdellovibrionaceae bacterium]